MPKRAVPYLTVGFGTRPQRLKLPPGMTPAAKPAAKAASTATYTSNIVTAVRPVTTSTLPVGTAPKGRPVSNLGDYLIKPTPESDTGFEMLNDQPDMIKRVEDQYLKTHQLPPALQPKYLRKPQVLDTNRAKNISKGWRNPRGRGA